MKNKKQAIFNLVIVAFVVMLAIASIFGGGDVVQAGPVLAPTPAANLVGGDAVPFSFRFQTATALTADTNTTGRDVMKWDWVDVHVIVDQTTTNTTTISAEYSNDNSNWEGGMTVSTANSASGDYNEITRVPVFGRYMRFKQDVINSNAITITLLAVAK